jgi:hypothetical protein
MVPCGLSGEVEPGTWYLRFQIVIRTVCYVTRCPFFVLDTSRCPCAAYVMMNTTDVWTQLPQGKSAILEIARILGKYVPLILQDLQ